MHICNTVTLHSLPFASYHKKINGILTNEFAAMKIKFLIFISHFTIILLIFPISLTFFLSFLSFFLFEQNILQNLQNILLSQSVSNGQSIPNSRSTRRTILWHEQLKTGLRPSALIDPKVGYLTIARYLAYPL